MSSPTRVVVLVLRPFGRRRLPPDARIAVLRRDNRRVDPSMPTVRLAALAMVHGQVLRPDSKRLHHFRGWMEFSDPLGTPVTQEKPLASPSPGKVLGCDAPRRPDPPRDPPRLRETRPRGQPRPLFSVSRRTLDRWKAAVRAQDGRPSAEPPLAPSAGSLRRPSSSNIHPRTEGTDPLQGLPGRSFDRL